MNRNRLFVSIEFRLVGALLAVLSLAALADFANTALVMRAVPPPDKRPFLDIGAYGLVGLLDNGAQVASRALYALGGLAAWLLVVLAVIAVVTLLFGVLLYFVGRGMRRGSGWTRVLGVGLTVFFALLPFSWLATVSRNGALVASVPIALSLYTLWVLIWRFNDAPG